MTFERRRLRVYVAGPISGDVYHGVQQGMYWGRKMFLAGLAPFVPHFDAFWFLPDGNWNAYLEYDLEYVAVADAVFRLDGASRGADLEVEMARSLDIPVYYQHPPTDEEGFWLYPNSDYRGLLECARIMGLDGKQRADA